MSSDAATGEMSFSLFSFARTLASTSGFATSRYMSRAGGMPVRFQLLTEGGSMSKRSAVAVVPPSSAITAFAKGSRFLSIPKFSHA